MNDNKIETTDTISFHNLHTIRFPSHVGDVTAVQKVNDVHEIEKQEKQIKNNNTKHEISVLYSIGAKNNVNSFKTNKKNISISFADASKSKSVPVVPIDGNIMDKTSKHRHRSHHRSHSAQCQNISLTSKLYSNYMHKTWSWLNFLGNGDKSTKFKKNRKKNKRDNGKSNTLLQKESHNSPLKKNKNKKVLETNDWNLKILYKKKSQPDKAINITTDTDKYAKNINELNKHSTNSNCVVMDNNDINTANVSKGCAETDNKNEHKSHDTKITIKKDKHKSNTTKHTKKYSDHKKVKSNIGEFTSELKEYFGLEQFGNCVLFKENPLQSVNSENNLNKIKKPKIIKRRVRKSHRKSKKLRSYQSTPFENEKVVEFSRHETKLPSIHKCHLPKYASIKKRRSLKGNASLLSIHGCRAVSNPDYCESETLLYSYQKCHNEKKSSHFMQKCSRNKRNSKIRCHKNIPSIEYKLLTVPIDKPCNHRNKDNDYYKVQCKCAKPVDDCYCPTITYSPKGKAKTWCKFLCRLRNGRINRKKKCAQFNSDNKLYNKKKISKHRSVREAQRVSDKPYNHRNKDNDYYYKVQYNTAKPVDDCYCPTITYLPKGKARKTWYNILRFLPNGRINRKKKSAQFNSGNTTYTYASRNPSKLYNKEKINKHRSDREAQKVNNKYVNKADKVNVAYKGNNVYKDNKSYKVNKVNKSYKVNKVNKSYKVNKVNKSYKVNNVNKVQKGNKVKKLKIKDNNSLIFGTVRDSTDPRYDPNIPIRRRLARLFFDLNAPKCQSCAFPFNRKPRITDLFYIPVKKNRKSAWQIVKRMLTFTASSLLLLPYWMCFVACQCSRCSPF